MVAVISMILAGIICWVQYEIFKESGLSGAMAALADYPFFTVASALLLASPVMILRRKPGWAGYLLGGFNSLAVAGYFGWRMITQIVDWMLGRVSLGYLLIGAVFALPFIVLFVRFTFGKPSRNFHGIGRQRDMSDRNILQVNTPT